MTQLEKQKLPVCLSFAVALFDAGLATRYYIFLILLKVESLGKKIGGDASPGRRWQLLYTAGHY